MSNKNELWKGSGDGLGDFAVVNRETKGKPLQHKETRLEEYVVIIKQ